jgi:diguanylate cyclase (GGDEF)-like protein
MCAAGKFRLALLVGCAHLALILLSGAVIAAAPEDAAQLLKHADSIKTSNHSEFTDILEQLGDASTHLPPSQQHYLHYLNAWQLVYSGDYAAAIPELNAVVENSDDVTLRFRAGVTAVNALALASRYEEAYARLSQLLEIASTLPDKDARLSGFGVAALLYNQAGQYDLAKNYAEKWVMEDREGPGSCKGSYLKLEALFKAGKVQPADKEFQYGIDACMKLQEFAYADEIRTFVANLLIEQSHTSDAIKLLKANYDDVQRTRYPRLMSEFDSILAHAYWKSGDGEQARQFALSAVDKSVKNEITKPLADAYQVLYQVAQKAGDYETALAYHEKFAATDKGYLTDTSARTLAYQMVTQQVLAKKREVDALNEKNQVLQLKQEVDAKSAETDRLYILLLIAVLGSIALWAWKTKRSQLRFMKLARRDGLTGIFNRQHFFDAAVASLKYCEKSAREACVIVIDLDNFKAVNDSYGHAAGDLVLKCAVAICKSHLRSIDIFGRLGGEEFGILLPDCTLETAMQRAEELRAAIVGLCSGDGGIDFPVSASFGVAGTRVSGYNLRQLLIDADGALYQAKREGRNRVAAVHEVVPGRAPAASTAQ